MPNKGYKQTEAAKEKNRLAHLGKKLSEKTKLKISKSHKGQIPWNKGLTYSVIGDMKEYKRKYYQANKVRYHQNDKIWRERNRDKLREHKRVYREKNKDKLISYHIKEKIKFPEKIKARLIANNNIKIKYANCENCNIYAKVEKHHPDYAKPLDVIFLCKLCHKKEHMELKRW